jgi:hypothetical protein
MRIIITERQQRLVEMDISIRRRLLPGIQYIEDLNPGDVCDNWGYDEVDDYVNGVLSDATLSCVGDDFNIYDKEYNYLSDEYRKEVTYFFYDSLCDDDEYGSVEETNFVVGDLINEAEYQGRKVQLGKIMQGDVKKSKVYVKNDKGKVVKVNFGFGGKSAHGKRMTIKKNNPARRKSFRARMNCDNPGPRWKARYWACRTW